MKSGPTRGSHAWRAWSQFPKVPACRDPSPEPTAQRGKRRNLTSKNILSTSQTSRAGERFLLLRHLVLGKCHAASYLGALGPRGKALSPGAARAPARFLVRGRHLLAGGSPRPVLLFRSALF